MKTRTHSPYPWVIATSLLLCGAVWAAQPVSVTNAGFEDPVLTDGSIENGNVPDWTAFNGGDIGVLNPSSTNDLTAEAPEGQNVAFILGTGNEDGLSQTLTSTFQADASYALTVMVANTKFTAGFPGYRVQLVANGEILAEDDNSQTVAEDAVVTSTVNYTYAAGDAGLVGRPLEIRLLSKGLTAGQEVAFDDVQLSVTLANPAADPGGPYTVPIGGSLSLDGGGSLPSDGQTITTWEWDLDNDGDFSDASGEAPTAISRENLETLFGMAVGDNAIQLRVSDSAAKTATTTGTVRLAAPIAGQLGILDLDANGGINPNTGEPWQVGDRYRLAFHTDETIDGTSNDPGVYDNFATAQAQQNAALASSSGWTAMVWVNTDDTLPQEDSPLSSPLVRSGTGDFTDGPGIGGAGVPVYAMDGTTSIARNNADIYNSWSNPFDGDAVIRLASGTTNNDSDGNPVTASQNVHYSPFLDQFGLGDTANVHGANVWTGGFGSAVNPLGDTTNEVRGSWGSSNANTAGRVWNRFQSDTTALRSVYALSALLTVVDLSETVAPTLISIADDRAGADAILGLNTVTYTVTFSEPIDASTVDSSDFGFAGTATATIDRVSGTLDPEALEVTVTPTSAGTLILQIEAGAVITDLVGNPLDTTTASVDDTTITVVEDATAPTLVSIGDDRAGASLVIGTGSIAYTVTFDEAMDAGTVEASDFENAGTATLSVDLVATTEDPAVFEVTVTPTTAGTLQLQIAAGAELTDLVGNPLDTSVALPDDTTITVDPDISAPVVDTLSPANGATGTSTGPILVATFSENIAKGTGNIEVRRSSDDSLVDTIDVTSGAVTVSGGEASISLGVVLDSLVGYYVLVESGAFTDLFGNAFSGITLKTEWGFTTGDFGLIGVTADGQFFPALFEEYGGQSWILIGRGREGWEFDTDGQGTPGEVGLNLKDPAGFAPKALSDAIVNDLLSQAGKSFPNDVVMRVMRASTTDGTGDYQELRYTNFTGFPNGNSEFTFFFDDGDKSADVERVNAPAGLPGASIGTGNASIRDHQADGNDADRIFTWDWNGHNFQQGFSMGQSVGGVDNNDPDTFLWEFANEAHAIPYSEVWLQLEVPSGGGNDFGDWIAGFPGLTDPDPAIDFDNGGLDTGIEWVVGGDPTDGSDDAGFTPTFDNTSDPDFFIFTYRRTDEAYADANTTIAVEYSGNLTGWTEAIAGADVVITPTDDGAGVGIDLVEVKIRRTLAVDNKLFARLSVTISP